MSDLRKITAPLIQLGEGNVLKNVVLVLDGSHKILDITSREVHDPNSLEKYEGILCPGFINAHCHLELSHLIGKIPTGTGLLAFLQKVVALRQFPESEIIDHIQLQDEKMREAGIVAVGDISNTIHSFATKQQSPIRYYTFVEMFDFWQSNAVEERIAPFVETWKRAPRCNGNYASAVGHAPYTVSPALFEKLNLWNEANATVSIHNQETAAEDEFFRHRKGGFIDFYERFGFSLEHFASSGNSSLPYSLAQIPASQNLLLVHNTMTRADDIAYAESAHPKLYWVSCPNANLYIENTLPDYEAFMQHNAKICLGTDSLSSNWQLSVFEEMKTIKKYKSGIGWNDLFKWACKNGAEALQMSDELGTIEKGKRPGINHISTDARGQISTTSEVNVVAQRL